MPFVLKNFLDTVFGEAHPRQKCESVSEWVPVWKDAQLHTQPFDPWLAAVSGALQADRLAWAFFCGYQGAIQSAFPTQARHSQVGAYCVNESNRKITEIATVIHREDRGMLLSGSKSWVLSEIPGLSLFVLAKIGNGPTAGPGSMTVVFIPADSTGVSRGDTRLQPMVPELAHGSVEFDSVRLEEAQVIEGDGYSDFAKPFRLKEDLFVTSSALAYLLGEARAGKWSTSWCQRCISAMSMLGQCTDLDPASSATHIVAAGALSFSGELIRESEGLWTSGQVECLNRWKRDMPILGLGKEAGRMRIATSWERVGWT